MYRRQKTGLVIVAGHVCFRWKKAVNSGPYFELTCQGGDWRDTEGGNGDTAVFRY
jgi:nitrate reductase beta subunit